MPGTSHSAVRSALKLAAALLVACAAAPLTSAVASAESLSPAMSHANDVAALKIEATQRAMPAGRYPYYTVGSSWQTIWAKPWGSAYLPGMEWYEYQRTGEVRWRTWAQQRQTPIGAFAGDPDWPDIGVLMLNSYRHGYRLTSNTAYRDVALKGAASMAHNYSPVVGMLRARRAPRPFTVVIDNMMNIELFFWGANNGGPGRWRTMAASHALRTAKDFMRPDGSSYHYVAYSEATGEVIEKGQLQGAFTESTWSRGQAWLIYGLAAAYRETGDARLLDAAHRAGEYWISHVPADLVPYWDFDAAGIPNVPRDSSAAAIAAAGFIELGRLDPDPARRSAYMDFARRTLESLSSPTYLAEGGPEPSVLRHGTFYGPTGVADHGTSWGDYFFLEALMRLRTQVLRVSGPDRYEAAVRASQLGFERAGAVVLVSGESFPDALAASSLAGVHSGPVLLTRPGLLPASVKAEIARLGAGAVYIVGGPRSVSETVAAEVLALPGVSVTRIGGVDRYEVAAKVAEEVAARRGASFDGRVFVVRGDVFADALAVSPIAYSAGMPVLLTRADFIPASTRRALGDPRVSGVVVCGGASSVPIALEGAIRGVRSLPPTRIAGADRYSTARAIATWARGEGLAGAGFVAVGSGLSFPDALFGGAATGARRGVMLMTDGTRLSVPTRDFLLGEGSGVEVRVFGGEARIAPPVENAIRTALPEQ